MALIRAFMGLFNYVLRLFLMNCIQKQAIFPPWALGQALRTQTTQFTIRYDTSKVHTIHTHIALWVRLNVKWEIGKCLLRPSF